MIFTLYYMYATFLQWWRLGTLKNKLSGTLNSHNALLLCDESIIFDTNRTRSFENLLFRSENRIGCTIVPKQKINLSSQWVTFPRDSRYFPIYFKHNRLPVGSPNFYVLLEAMLETYKKHQAEILQVENFGELVAWKVSDHFEAILKTDMDKLTKLVQCFSQKNCDINHELQMLRIETVDVEGKPKKIKFERRFSKESTLKYSLAPVHWRKFVADVKDVYSKIRDATNPKITIDNGTPKPEDLKKVPVSEVKLIKKDKKAGDDKDRHTLDVNSTDYRKHKEHGKKDKDKTSDRHKVDKEKSREDKEHKVREHKKHKTKDELDSSKHHKRDKETKNGESSLHKKDKEDGHNRKKNNSDVSTRREKNIILNNGKMHNGDQLLLEKENAASSSSEPKPAEKLRQESRTSSKEKKLVRSSATCEESNHENDISSPESEVRVDKNVLRNVKPPNILVYAESAVAKGNVKDALRKILNRERFTIYDLPTSGNTTWKDLTVLVVVCGNVDPKLTSILMKYLLNGGQLLCLCSDLLYSVLYTFTTAEVREHELVRFSYGKWKNVKMMHHVFCYQASPAKKQFSKDSDASNHSSGSGSSPIAPRTPSTVEIQHGGKDYIVNVQVLGTEETWHTPSLLLATVKGSEGRAVFSQVHLEIDPDEFIEDEGKFEALKDSNEARLEILRDILSNHLDMDCNNDGLEAKFTPAYFLGRHDLKMNMLQDSHSIRDLKMKVADLQILFCGKNDQFDEPSRTFLPILIHACPQNFNTVSYFETLDTKHFGRLLIYSDVLYTSHPILTHNQLAHGIAVVCRQQLGAVGRSSNMWLSPPGSASFSLQFNCSLSSNLGKSLALVQHIQMVAVIRAVKKLTGDGPNIQIGIKWPNDLYINGCVKIGGLIVTSSTMGSDAIVNIGCGVNLSNPNPTVCINDIIKETNQKTGTNIPEITHEKFFAQVFNETEKVFDRFQSGDEDYFYDYYYEYWLHNDAVVTVTLEDNKPIKGRIVGIDNFGFLRVRTPEGEQVSFQPDGNSFDMMKGLIYRKSY